MYRHWLYYLATILTITGCSTDGDTASTDHDGSVRFLVDSKDVTRGSVIGGETLPQTETFRVYAWKTVGGVTTEMMTSDAANPESNVVSCASGYWTPQKRYFWPTEQDASVSYYAVYPKDFVIRQSGDDVTIDLQIPTAVSDQHDMMTAMNEGATLSTSANGAARLTFRHITSQVAFRARMSAYYSGWQVAVYSLRLCNVNSRGTYRYATHTVTPASPAVLQNYDLQLASPEVSVSSTSEEVMLTDPANVAMLMPQALTPWDRQTETASTTVPSTTGCYLAIGCTITDNSGNRAFSGNTYIPFPVSWTAARRYSYLLEFGGGYQGSGDLSVLNILLSCSISDWQPGNNGNVDISQD